MTGKRVWCRFSAIRGGELLLARDREVADAHRLDEIATVRRKGLSLVAEIGIGAAIGFVLLGALAYVLVGGQAQ